MNFKFSEKKCDAEKYIRIKINHGRIKDNETKKGSVDYTDCTSVEG